MVNINERFVTVMLKHGTDTLTTKWRYVLAKHWIRISPIIAHHCIWPDTSTYPPGNLKVGTDMENKTASINTREGVRIVNDVEAQRTKKALFELRIRRILHDAR